MKSTIRTEVKNQQRRARIWARIVQASKVVQAHAKITHHVGTAY